MEIEIIKATSIEVEIPEQTNTKYFALFLLKSLSYLRLLHWYTDNFNYHSIVGELYESLDNLFDKFQEEIIGTSSNSNIPFPGFSPDSINLDEIIETPTDLNSFLDCFQKTTTLLRAYLNSPELSNYIESVPSGLNNTKEEIISAINKATYLLNMVNVTAR